jgi:FtsP/CotA-like multicopper oxidase with cupredoxin domain
MSGAPARASAAASVPRGGALREYWIQADAFLHNLVPMGLDGMMGTRYAPHQTSYWALGYRAYTPGWGQPLAGNDALGPNTGIPGPVLRATVGDTIRVHFRNNDRHYRFPHSIHPHGVVYRPESDGSWTALDPQKPGTAIGVGESYTYEYTVAPSSVGTWLYHDHSVPQALGKGGPVMELGAELGLFGIFAITDAQTPLVDREVCLFMHDLYQADIPVLAQDFDCFNGRAFLGNTPTITARVGERVRWRVAALGKEFHAFHLHGHRWLFNGRYDDTLVLGPATTVTFDFVEDNPGTWLYHCHVTDHMMGGMVGRYVVTVGSVTGYYEVTVGSG